jgi:hypothetical protein
MLADPVYIEANLLGSIDFSQDLADPLAMADRLTGLLAALGFDKRGDT